MITQVNGIGSSAALSKKPKTSAKMEIDRVRIPRDVAFTGAKEQASEVATGFFKRILDSKIFNGVRGLAKKVPGFFAETLPKYARAAGNFFKKFLPKAKDTVAG